MRKIKTTLKCVIPLLLNWTDKTSENKLSFNNKNAAELYKFMALKSVKNPFDGSKLDF